MNTTIDLKTAKTIEAMNQKIQFSCKSTFVTVSWQCVSPKASMRLSLQPTRTGNTFIITLSTTPLRWTAPGNSGIFYCPGWLCNG